MTLPSALPDDGHPQPRMPQPQYLGAKYRLLGWISRFVAIDGGAILDGFGGSQSFAYEMKKSGFAVHTNDFLNFCYQSGLALVENHGITLDDNDIAMLFSETLQQDGVMRQYEGIFFSGRECAVLDNFRANADRLGCSYKRAIALATMCRSMTRKTIMGHFAHLRAMEYAAEPVRVKRNPSIARDIRDVFLELLPQYNAAVFDNRQENRSYHQNVLDLLPSLRGVDLAYYDPPYCQSHADYQAFYHLLETFAENWRDKQFINGNLRYHPPRYSGFDKARDVEKSFRLLFEMSEGIPHWLISYNDRSFPKVEELVRMARRHKKVRVEENVYRASRGGKGSVAGSREYLFICE